MRRKKDTLPVAGPASVERGKGSGAALVAGGSVHASLANEIGMRIVRGDYPPGTILPNEAKWSETFEVSRSAVREAIKMLMAKSLLSSRPKVGSWVEPRERWNLLDRDVLGWYAHGAGSRILPAHRAGIPPHHRTRSDGAGRRAPHRRADGRDQRGLPRHGRGDVACRAAPMPTPASTSPSCALRATTFWCRSAC